ncbi:NAD(P)-dependent oxidoreductase [Flavobacterium sp. JP2137]|uniref:NAD(P)-dependent oxidoreductase n=1 Tax=Flavobacterium sp. JP2137 TaxID=3414510 RepID=UPI003D300B5B
MKILVSETLPVFVENDLKVRGFEIIQVKVAQEQLANYINTHEIAVLLLQKGRKITRLLIDSCAGLKYIIIADSQIDLEYIDYAVRHGVQVMWAEKTLANATAELVMAHLLTGSRLLQESNRNMPLEGEVNFKGLQKAYANGVELAGKTMGIIGMNPAGQLVAQKALGMGMHVVYWDADIAAVRREVVLAGGMHFEMKLDGISMDAVLEQAHFLSVHTTHFERYILNKEAFDKAIHLIGVINCAYPEAVNEVHLVDLLNDEKILFAGLDRFEEEPNPAIQVLMQPGISLSPNINGASNEVQQLIWLEICELFAKCE